MSVGDARTFLKQAVADKRLRDQLNEAGTREAMDQVLKTLNINFTQTELEEAYHGLLMQSQTEMEASIVQEIKGWWDFLSTAMDR